MTSPVEEVLAGGGYDYTPGEAWDLGGQSVSSLSRLLTSANYQPRTGPDEGNPYGQESDLLWGARQPFLNRTSSQDQISGSPGYDANSDYRTNLPAGWSDVTVDPDSGVAWGVDAQGQIIPGSNYSVRTNDDATFIAGAVGILGVGASAGAFGGAAAGGGGAGAGGGGTAVAGVGEGYGGLTAADAASLGGGSSVGGGTAGGIGAGEVAAVGGAALPGATAGAGGNSTPPTSGSNPSWWDQLLSGMGGSGGSGGMGMRDWLSILSGVYGMNLASNARDEMDPFRSERPYYQDRLRELEQNPSLITQRPGWQTGVNTINREMASRGYLGGGNQAIGLSRFSGDFYNQEMNRLAALAGSHVTPGAGMGIYTNLIGQSLGSIGYGMGNMGNRGAGSGSYFGGGYTNPGEDPEGVNRP